MRVIKQISKLRLSLLNQKKIGKKVHLIPTMGALHDGHISLVKSAKAKKATRIVSIFINPDQFSPNEDFDKYPSTIKNDLKLLRKERVDIVFLPNKEEIKKYKIKYKIPNFSIENKLCGKTRPHFFPGVKKIVTKLFDIIEPDKSFFGEKDFQQYLVIKELCKKMKLKTVIVKCKTVRDKKGLALSSRNNYLNENEKKMAQKINKSVKKFLPFFRENLKVGRGTLKLKQDLFKHGIDSIDYLKIFTEQLTIRKKLNDKCRLFIAVKIGNTRLIDNYKI
tara:strand:- start:327 stop:1160 length:834 start_codon:yes stop_codon:yes gene_type:complete